MVTRMGHMGLRARDLDAAVEFQRQVIVLLENHVIRHMGDIEVIHTYEGTATMQALIVGRDITGVGAFV
jgi:alkylation response protein AidB-like acyl-CoA dehydrogenase